MFRIGNALATLDHVRNMANEPSYGLIVWLGSAGRVRSDLFLIAFLRARREKAKATAELFLKFRLFHLQCPSTRFAALFFA